MPSPTSSSHGPQSVPKKALVTGGATGIGLAIVNRFQSLGYAVFVLTPPDEDTRSINLLREVTTIESDFRFPETIPRAFRHIATLTDSIDVLINNAGIFPRQPFHSLTLQEWLDTMNVNLTAPFLCSQCSYELLTKNARSYIINITSDAYFLGPRDGIHYAASKAGLVGLTRSLARIMASHGGIVLAVAPGITRTRQSISKSPEYDQIAKEIPLGRIAESSDIAAAVASLVSGAFDYMTGQTIHLNGGRHMR